MGLAHDSFGWDLHPAEQHVAGLLAAQGYQTHLFGLQHVTMEIERLGFDHVHRRTLAPAVAEDVEAVLASRQFDSPFYLEINLEEPHRPFDQGGVQPDLSGGVQVPSWLPDTAASREEFAALQGAVHTADTAIGRILASIDAAGLADSTLVVFTADHGLAMPRAKCTLYDAGIGVALIARWPGGGFRTGSTIGELISNVDVLPTLLEASGSASPPNLHGRSFLPLLRGETCRPRQEIYAEKTFHSYYDPMRAIRTDRYKFIRNFETCFAVEVPGDVQLGAIYRTEVQRYISTTHPDVEFYDLDADPFEQQNLAGHPDIVEIARDLDTRLWQWMAETGDPLLSGPVPSPAYRRSIAHRQT
jgi:arylsulfatase A-like enzyme